MKYHDIFEEKEIDYRRQIFENFDRKKKSRKEIKKEIAEAQKAYKNLYNIFDIDGEEKKKEKWNIIKIKLY